MTLSLSLSVSFFLIALGTSLAMIPMVTQVALKTGLVDLPAHRKTHQHAIPYLGGIAIFFGITVPLFIFFNLHSSSLTSQEKSKLLLFLLISGSSTILGLVDDKWSIRARYKLALQILITGIFSTFFYRFQTLRIPGIDPIPFLSFEVPITMIWMLTVINGFNLIDGIDGLAGSVSCAILLTIALNALRLHNLPVQIMALIAAGSTFGFLIKNWRPARIFLGESGSFGLGTLSAALLVSMGSGSEEAFPFQFLAVTLIAVYPILEVTLSILRRLSQGKSIGSADRGHIHHKLTFQGWNPQKIAFTAALVTFCAGSIVYTNIASTRGVTAWLILLTTGLISILLHYCGYLKALNINNILESRPHFLLANQYINLQKTRLKLTQNINQTLLLIQQTFLEFGVDRYRITLNPDSTYDAAESFDWKDEGQIQSTRLLNLTLTFEADNHDRLTDRVSLPKTKSHAIWHFTPRRIAHDLDIEHRILLHDFVKEAIRCLEKQPSKQSSAAEAHSQNQEQ